MAVQFNTTYRLGDFSLHPETRGLSRGEKDLHLARNPFRVLVYLIEHRDRLVTRAELLEKFWEGRDVYDETLTKCVGTIRKALDDGNANSRFIETRYAEGYRYIGPFEEIDVPAVQVERTRGVKIVIEEEEIKFAERTSATARRGSPQTALVIGRMQSSPRRFATTIAVATTIIVIAVGASVFYHNSGRSNVSAKSPSLTPAPLNSIAVLPLQNITRDPTQDYFSDGLTESFITNLSRIQGLKVISRSSAFTLKGQTNTQEIGNKLGVSTVLEGAVQQDGDRVRVSVRLVNAADGRVLWTSQTYDRELKDIFNVEDEIACSITAELRVKLCGEVDSSRHYTENIAAYQAYLKGRYLINNQYTELNTVGPVRNLEQAIMYFQQAAKIDPNYAPAYAGLADAYTGMVWFSPEEPKALIERAKAAALKANELDDTLASAHTALGTVYIHEWNFAAAGQEYERAVALNPGDAAAHDGYATYLMAAGRVAEMLTETKRAVELDPLNVYISGDRGSCLYFARKYDESIAEFQRLNDVAQDAGAAGNIGLCYLGKGMYPEAVTAFQTAKARTTVKGLVPNAIANLAIGRAMAGNKAEAERLLNELTAMAKTQYVPQTFFAGIYTALDQKNRAFVSLNKAYQRHDSTLIGLKLSPLFDPLRSDPRFADILRDVRLPSD